jgi:hypothetical protein
MKRYYIRYRDRRTPDQFEITEKEYLTIETERAKNTDKIIIKSINKTEYLKDFVNFFEFTNIDTDGKRKLSEEIKQQIDEDEDFKKENRDRILREYSEKIGYILTVGELWGIKQGLIKVKDKYTILHNKEKDSRYWEIEAVNDWFEYLSQKTENQDKPKKTIKKAKEEFYLNNKTT